MDPHATTSGMLVRPRPVTSRYGPGETPAKRRAARLERRLRAFRMAQTVPHIPRGSRVLDVGCGDGELFRWLGSRLGLGVGIDPTLPGSVVGARYRMTKGWFPEDLPDVGLFDVVTMLAVLEEVPIEGRAWLFAACLRRLLPGGRLTFTAPPEVADQVPMAVATRLEVGPEDLFVCLVDYPSASDSLTPGPGPGGLSFPEGGMSELEQVPFDGVDFAENPEPRCPCLLLLDTSASMSGRKIGELSSGLQAFADQLQGDSMAAKRVEVAIVTFGPVQTLRDLHYGRCLPIPPPRRHRRHADGRRHQPGARPGGGAEGGLPSNGIGYYRPWVFLITDGAPTDDVTAAAAAIREGEAAKSFMFYVVGVDGADMERLRQLSVRPSCCAAFPSGSCSSGCPTRSAASPAPTPARRCNWRTPWRRTAGPSPAEVGMWRFAAARATGTSHERIGAPCQDRLVCTVLANGALVAAVSDGAGPRLGPRSGRRSR